MNKRIVIGDMHGNFDRVKEIYDHANPDEVILLGDYMDSFVNDADKVHDSFDKLLKLKEEHEKNHGMFVLLIGNHDFHYMFDNQYERYSGYNPNTNTWANAVLNNLHELGKLQFVYVDEKNKYIYSHAGVTNTWLMDNKLSDINGLDLNYFTFTSDKLSDMYGNSVYQGPLWVRPRALSTDLYKDSEGNVWKQFVGHTQTKVGMFIEDDKICLLDCIPNYYLEQLVDENGLVVENNIIKLHNYTTEYIQ